MIALGCAGLFAAAVSAATPAGQAPLEVYRGGLAPDWKDYGWAPRTLEPGAPARFDFSGYAGWIVAHPTLRGPFGALVFRLQAPAAFGDFLEVRVESSRADVFPRLTVARDEAKQLEGDWLEVTLPFARLDPQGAPFEQLVFRAQKAVGHEPVLLDGVAFTAADAASRAAPASAAPARAVAMRIDCGAPGHAIRPMIYGIGFAPLRDGHETHQWELGASARRWGGNPTSRYNWERGNAWNTANDWFFTNINYTGDKDYGFDRFLEEDLARGLRTALTVPLLGWVAKDTSSYSFPVSVFGKQQATAPENRDAGNGRTGDGKPIAPGSPTRTSVAAPPGFIGRWVAAIRAKDEKRGRSVHEYILDNEPALWNDTHRDVHPSPVTYDELLERTIAYASAIRRADPQATIAGPAEWGWPALFYSAEDAAQGFRLHPDRLAHGNVPLIPWYLRKLRQHEKQHGTRLLDVLDVHFYPQAKVGVGQKGGTDAATAALRLRTTRGLWDPTYVDESWIGEPVRLLPRLREWVDEESPGLGISIGEWNFGAEDHISGGLAVAEALGRFGEAGISSAFYWDVPPARSPAFWAFRLFRNYDGKGGRFLDRSVPTRVDGAGASLFASRDEGAKRVVAVLLNLDGAAPLDARIDVASCGAVTAQRTFAYAGGEDGPAEIAGGAAAAREVRLVAAPWSMTAIELTVGPRR